MQKRELFRGLKDPLKTDKLKNTRVCRICQVEKQRKKAKVTKRQSLQQGTLLE